MMDYIGELKDKGFPTRATISRLGSYNRVETEPDPVVAEGMEAHGKISEVDESLPATMAARRAATHQGADRARRASRPRRQ